jgi:hypothetical protein
MAALGQEPLALDRLETANVPAWPTEKYHRRMSWLCFRYRAGSCLSAPRKYGTW